MIIDTGPPPVFQDVLEIQSIKEWFRRVWDALALGTLGIVDNRIPRSDGTGGRTFQATGITVDDSNNVSGVVGLTMTGAITGGTNNIIGSVGTTDNKIPRSNGTGGLTLQSGNITLSDAGEMNNTLQPAFLAYNSADDLNVTGNGTVATVDFDTEVFDQGSDFAADTFTAPVNGRYLLISHVRIGNLTAAADSCEVRIVTSNRTYGSLWTDTNDMPIPVPNKISVIADMEAGDTAGVRIIVTGEASDVCDVDGTAVYTYFSGCLLA